MNPSAHTDVLPTTVPMGIVIINVIMRLAIMTMGIVKINSPTEKNALQDVPRATVEIGSVITIAIMPPVIGMMEIAAAIGGMIIMSLHLNAPQGVP